MCRTVSFPCVLMQLNKHNKQKSDNQSIITNVKSTTLFSHILNNMESLLQHPSLCSHYIDVKQEKFNFDSIKLFRIVLTFLMKFVNQASLKWRTEDNFRVIQQYHCSQNNKIIKT